MREGRTNVRGHIVRAFGGVPIVLIFLGNQALEKVTEIQRDIGVGILLNHQRAGRVLNERREQPIRDTLF